MLDPLRGRVKMPYDDDNLSPHPTKTTTTMMMILMMMMRIYTTSIVSAITNTQVF